MHLTKRGEYALRALVRLGIEHAAGHTAVSVSVLAEKEKLPFKFLELILYELKQAGFIEKVRGKDEQAMKSPPRRSSTPPRPAAAPERNINEAGLKITPS